MYMCCIIIFHSTDFYLCILVTFKSNVSTNIGVRFCGNENTHADPLVALCQCRSSPDGQTFRDGKGAKLTG